MCLCFRVSLLQSEIYRICLPSHISQPPPAPVFFMWFYGRTLAPNISIRAPTPFSQALCHVPCHPLWVGEGSPTHASFSVSVSRTVAVCVTDMPCRVVMCRDSHSPAEALPIRRSSSSKAARLTRAAMRGGPHHTSPPGVRHRRCPWLSP